MTAALARLSILRSSSRLIRRSLVMAVVAGTVLPVSSAWVRTALAEPRGAQVVAGNVNIRTNGNSTVIRASNGSIINYQQFNIGVGQTVRFIQPNANSRVLNRITGNSPTLIQGSLFANGQVFFINPAGVTFSRGAVVNVGGIVAAAANISDADFASGNIRFTGASGQVINDGTITGSMVGLIGKQVTNTGTIQTPGANGGGENGWVVLAAGDEVFIGETGRRVMVKVDPAAQSAPVQGVGVEQSGTINAGRGRVDLASGDLYSTAMRIGGVTSAGNVRAEGAGRGTVEVTGTIDVSNRGAGGKGGRVEVLGQNVVLDHALINASGTSGGGEIRLGGTGSAAAGEDLRSAETTVVRNGSELHADATSSGSGGSIILWSTTQTDFAGVATADSTAGFHGGLIETSSAGVVKFDASMIRARGGTWLVDPAGDMIISDVDPLDAAATWVTQAMVEAALNAGTDFAVHATNDVRVSSNITKAASASGAKLTLNADHDLVFDGGVQISTSGVGVGKLNIELTWGNQVTGLSGVLSNIGTLTYNLGTDITIGASGGSGGGIAAQGMIADFLNVGTNVVVTAAGVHSITTTAAVSKTLSASTATLTLDAGSGLTFSNVGVISTGPGPGIGKLDLVLSLRASGALSLNDPTALSTQFASLGTISFLINNNVDVGTVAGPGHTLLSNLGIGTLLSAGTNVNIVADGANALVLGAAITKSAGADCTLTLRAGGDVTLNALGGVNSSSNKLNLSLMADSPTANDGDGTGDLTVGSTSNLNGGTLSVRAHDFANTGTFNNVGGAVFSLDGTLPNFTNINLSSNADLSIGGRFWGGMDHNPTLGADLVFTTGTGNFTFTSGLNANTHAININRGAGKIAFQGLVTGATTISLASTNAAVDAISIAGVTTSGAQTFTGNSTLTGAYTITGASNTFTVTGNSTLAGDTTITTNAGAISFLGSGATGRIDGDGVVARMLTLDAGAAAITIQGATGATTALSRLLATGSTISVVSVKTVGDGSMNPSQLYNGATTFFGTFNTADTALRVNGNLTLNANPGGGVIVNAGAGDIFINGGINGSGSRFNLTLNSTGLTHVAGNIASVGTLTTNGSASAGDQSQFDGTVGTTNSLAINDFTTLGGATYATSGSQTFARTVTYTGGSAATFSATNAAAGISFQGNYAGGSRGLTVNTNAGVVAFGGDVSGVAALGTNTGAAGNTTFAANKSVTANSVSTVNGASIGAGATITATSGDLHFAGASSVGDAAILHTTGGSGAINFDSAVSFLGSSALTGSSLLVIGTTSIGSGGTLSVDTIASGGNITFTGSVSGPGGLQLSSGLGKISLVSNTGTGGSSLASLTATSTNAAADAISLHNVSTTGNQLYTANLGGVTLSGDTYATSNADFTIHGITTLGATTTVSTGSGDAIFDGTLTGTFGLTVNSTGDTEFHDNINIGALTTNAGGQSIFGRAAPGAFTVTTAGPINIGDNAVLKAGTYTFNSAGGSNAANRAITFGGSIAKDAPGSVVSLTLDAGMALAAANRGNITVTGAVGAVMAELAAFHVFGNIVTINGALTNVGDQTYNGVDVILNGLYNTGSLNFVADGTSIHLGGNTVVTTTGDATFMGPLFLQGHDLNVNADGMTSFVNAISGLGTITTSAAGSTEFHGNIDVGGLSIHDAASLFGATVTTAGAMDFFSTLALQTGVTLASTSGDIRLFGAVDGNGSGMTANSLTLNVSNGHLALIGAGAADIDQLRSGPNGTVQIQATGGMTLAANLVNFQHNVELLGTSSDTVTIDTVAANGAIAIGGATSGSPKLVLAAGTGTITLAGATTGVRGLQASGGTLNIGSVQTVGDGVMLTGSTVINLTGDTYQVFGTNIATFAANGPVVFVGNAARTISTDAGAIGFSSSVTGSVGHNNLTINTPAFVTFGGIVTGLGAITTDAGGRTTFMGNVDAASLSMGDAVWFHGSTITTSGSQTYAAIGEPSLELFNDATLSATGISFNAVSGGGNDLTVNSSSTTAFHGDLGGVDQLSTAASGTGTTIDSGVTLAIRQATFGDDVVVGENAHINATGMSALVNFGKTVDLGDQAAIAVAGTGARADFIGAVTLSGDSASVTASSGADAVQFHSAVNGDAALTVNSDGAATFDAAIGGSDALASLTVSGAQITVQNIHTHGNQSLTGATSLMGSQYALSDAGASFVVTGSSTLGASSTTVAANNGLIKFDGTLNGASAVTLHSGTGSNAHVMLMGDAGSGIALTSLLASGGDILAHSVRTQMTQAYRTDLTGAGSGTVTLMGTMYQTLHSDASHSPGTAEAFLLDGRALIGQNATVQTATGIILFTSTIDDMSAGSHSLTLRNTDALSRSTNPIFRFGGDIGALAKLSSITFDGNHGVSTLSAPGKEGFARDNATILFASGLLDANGNIGAIDAEPTAAFVIKTQGDFLMGESDRLLSFGDLTIEAGSVKLAGTNVLGKLTVTAGEAAHFWNGANIVASEGFAFNQNTDTTAKFGVNPGVAYEGSNVRGLAVFLDRALTFKDFNTQFLSNVTITGGTMAQSLMLMQPADGPTAGTINEFSVSPIVSDQDTVRRYQPATVGGLAEGLREFNLELRDLDPQDLSEFLVGRSFYTDLPSNVPAKANESKMDFGVTRNRLEQRTLADALAALDQLLGKREGNLREKARERGKDVATAWDKYRASTESPTIVGFKQFLSENPDLAGATQTMADLELVMKKVDALALSPQETRILRSAVITKLAKGNPSFIKSTGKGGSLSERLLEYFQEPTLTAAR